MEPCGCGGWRRRSPPNQTCFTIVFARFLLNHWTVDPHLPPQSNFAKTGNTRSWSLASGSRSGTRSRHGRECRYGDRVVSDIEIRPSMSLADLEQHIKDFPVP